MTSKHKENEKQGDAGKSSAGAVAGIPSSEVLGTPSVSQTPPASGSLPQPPVGAGSDLVEAAKGASGTRHTNEDPGAPTEPDEQELDKKLAVKPKGAPRYRVGNSS